ncbi:MAG: lipid kinase YegS [Hyphomicrobiaceae bacterium]
MNKSSTGACLILHKKSCMRPEVKAAIKAAKKSGVELTIRIPWTKRDISTFVKQAIKGGISRIIAGGGDGTLGGVANCLMQKNRAKKTSLGVFPLGTANDFARGAGVPREDLVAALQLAATGEATPIDVGEVNGRYFVNVASGGFGAEITATTPRDLKAALGGIAYSIVGLARVLEFKPYRGTYTGPDGVPETGTMMVMAVGNNRFAGGGFEVAPSADLQDGLLDVAILSTDELPPLGAIRAELKDPMNVANRFLRYRQVPSFSVEADRPLHLNLDGEPMIERRFHFDTHPGALRVVLGKSAR